MQSFSTYLTEMKPKILPAVNVEKVMNQLKTQCLSYHKRGGSRVGGCEWWETNNNNYYLMITHNQGSAAGMKEFLQSKPVRVIDIEWHDGHYDWAADVYNKPYSIAHIQLVQV